MPGRRNRIAKEEKVMTGPTPEEAEIRKSLDELAQALRTKDIETLMAHYAADTVVFDLRPPAQIESADRYRQNFEAWFGSVEGPIGYEVRELAVTAVAIDEHDRHLQPPSSSRQS
jgi:ketosteroid isomerase-like protein